MCDTLLTMHTLSAAVHGLNCEETIMKRKKLVLKKETLRRLNASEMRSIDGGRVPTPHHKRGKTINTLKNTDACESLAACPSGQPAPEAMRCFTNAQTRQTITEW